MTRTIVKNQIFRSRIHTTASALWICLSLLFIFLPLCSCAADKEHAHSSMSCTGCHKENGNPSAQKPACINCHDGKHSAPRPSHAGFTQLHMDRIACESCHIRDSVAHWQKSTDRSSAGKIVPVDNMGMILHHDVSLANNARGANGCGDCHSSKSKFPTGSTSNEKKFGMWREKFLKPASGWIFAIVIAMSICHYLIFGPHKFKSIYGEPEILRFTIFERFFHWAAMGSFALLAGSGIMFLLHIENPQSHLRSIHGHIGIVFVFSLVGMFGCWWRNAKFVSYDKDWLRGAGNYFWFKRKCMAGKFNAGQKLFFWVVAVGFGILISATGFMLDCDNGHAPSWVFTLHDFAAIVLIAAVIGHIYLSILANPGTISSMITGKVRQSWAKLHHPYWLNKQ